ncbi:AbrB/MazE/SpoVT family DNA-binding domain-containing protein [Candidatus Peregrinibacteria bacterium]|nr:MAG: AbrB/MazE/SpoVT family DNA-binding domain-containing protein [Candidatus Peregrinibacteria bacterium]
MKTKVSKWGNSLGLRIPKVFAAAIPVKAGTVIQMQLVGKKIILSPPEETLKEMVAQITPENRHDLLLEFDTVGKEIW